MILCVPLSHAVPSQAPKLLSEFVGSQRSFIPCTPAPLTASVSHNATWLSCCFSQGSQLPALQPTTPEAGTNQSAAEALRHKLASSQRLPAGLHGAFRSPTPPGALSPVSGVSSLSGNHREASAGGISILASPSNLVVMAPASNGSLLQSNPMLLQPSNHLLLQPASPVLLLQQAYLQLLQPQANPVMLLQQAHPQQLQQVNPQAFNVTQGHPACFIPAGYTAGPPAQCGSSQAGQPAQAMSLQAALAAAAAAGPQQQPAGLQIPQHFSRMPNLSSSSGLCHFGALSTEQQQQHTGLPALQPNSSLAGLSSSGVRHLGAFGTQQQQQQATALHALQLSSSTAGPSSSSQQQQHHAVQPGPGKQLTPTDIAAAIHQQLHALMASLSVETVDELSQELLRLQERPPLPHYRKAESFCSCCKGYVGEPVPQCFLLVSPCVLLHRHAAATCTRASPASHAVGCSAPGRQHPNVFCTSASWVDSWET